jgi:hypothetical protein
MSIDWYPQSADARMMWHLNFAPTLATFATKYNISAAMTTSADNDAAFMEAFVGLRNSADAFRQQLTKYFNDIAGNDPSLPQPTLPVAPAIPVLPTMPPPGIEFRVRELARQIKGHMAYSEADGEALGIVSTTPVLPDPALMKPVFTLRTLSNFELETTFRKKGMDALRFEVRQNGSGWVKSAFLLTSPGAFAVVPATPGTSQQVEVRAIFVEKNSDVGNFSDIVTAFIAP